MLPKAGRRGNSTISPQCQSFDAGIRCTEVRCQSFEAGIRCQKVAIPASKLWQSAAKLDETENLTRQPGRPPYKLRTVPTTVVGQALRLPNGWNGRSSALSSKPPAIEERILDDGNVTPLKLPDEIEGVLSMREDLDS